MFMYLRVDHWVPAMWRSRAAARFRRIARRERRRPRGCAGGSRAGCARAGCWCGCAASAPPGRRSRPASRATASRPARRPCRGADARNSATTAEAFWAALKVLLGVDRLQHRGHLAHLRRRHVAEDVAVEVHHAPLPARVREELGGALDQPQAGVGDDQLDALEAALLQVLQERRPAGLVLLGALADAEYLAGSPRRSPRSPPAARRCAPRRPRSAS